MKGLFSSLFSGLHVFVVLMLLFCLGYGLSNLVSATDEARKAHFTSGLVWYAAIAVGYLILLWLLRKFQRKLDSLSD